MKRLAVVLAIASATLFACTVSDSQVFPNPPMPAVTTPPSRFAAADASVATLSDDGGESGGAGQSDPSSLVPSGNCPGTAGPTMVWLPQGYCIDSTEVTVGQFNKWLATKPTPPKLGEVCGRTSFGPSVSCMASGYVCKKACDNYPVVCVDWCDASAYCKAAGKRLCGAIGGGPIGQHDYADPTVDQWFNACSANGKNIYPYGDDYGPKTCNGADLRVANSHPVAYAPECQSTEPGYLGIYDMSGNVWEWEDFCYEQDGLVLCNARGGSFYDGERDMQCNAVYNWVPMIGETPRNERTRASDSFGFRCCS